MAPSSTCVAKSVLFDFSGPATAVSPLVWLKASHEAIQVHHLGVITMSRNYILF